MLSFPEILVILIVAVIVLGPKRLPETARKIGRWIGIFKQASEEFKRELMTMDRAVNDTLNRATSDLDALEPEVTQVFENVEASITDVYNATTLPPTMTPDEVLAQAPIPGGLASTPPAAVLDSTATNPPPAAAQSASNAHSTAPMPSATVVSAEPSDVKVAPTSEVQETPLQTSQKTAAVSSARVQTSSQTQQPSARKTSTMTSHAARGDQSQ